MIANAKSLNEWTNSHIFILTQNLQMDLYGFFPERVTKKELILS